MPTIRSYSDVRKVIGKEMADYRESHPGCKMGEPMRHAFKTEAVKKALAEYKAIPKDKRPKTVRKTKSGGRKSAKKSAGKK